STANGKLPLTVEGRIKPGVYELAGNVSSQFVTGLMFALPLLNGDSTIVITTELESKGYVDLTIDVLNRFSIDIKNDNYKKFYIKGKQKYMATDYKVEGDYSQAAFWLVAGAINGDITLKNLSRNSLQADREILNIVSKMGANIIYGEKYMKS